MTEKKDTHADELDRFWDISALLPARRVTPPRDPRSVEATEITIEPRTSHAGVTDQPIKPASHKSGESGDSVLVRRFIPPHTAQEFDEPQKPDDEYSPDHLLIHRVRLFNWKTSYNYYEQFLGHARKIRNVRGHECAPVPFFSYVPQYSQLSRQQLAWYLWWRECAVKGNYLKTDYSYILLFVYEIINTGGHGNPSWGQDQLCGLWISYREEFSRLDKLLGEWICDFSLIYHLSPPTQKLDGILSDAMHSCALKEFYMPPCEDSTTGYCNMLLTYCSNYDYKSSKFAKGDAKALYDEHVRGALTTVLKRFSGEKGQILSATGLEDSHMIRDAYAGALCSYEAKRRIEVDYCSFSRSHELRFMVSDIVKYSENKIRACLGIKSRLSIYALPTPVRACIDEYFVGVLPKKRRQNEAEAHEYDKLYEAPKTKVSVERAAEIEQTSWETTERLIEAFEETADSTINSVMPDETETPINNTVTELPEPENFGGEKAEALAADNGTTQGPDKTLLAASLGELIEFVRLARDADFAGQARYAAARGEMADYIADRINEIAVGIIGDVILEDAGCCYTFIDDYEGDVFNG